MGGGSRGAGSCWPGVITACRGAVQVMEIRPGLWPGGGGNIEKNERIVKE